MRPDQLAIASNGPLRVRKLKRMIRGCERRLNVAVRPGAPRLDALKRLLSGELY
jgi:hypothetical protein